MTIPSGMKQAIAEAVAKEINEHRREREVQAAKIDAALDRLDRALARVEAGGSASRSDAFRGMITR